MTSIRHVLGAARRAGLRLALGALPLALVSTVGAQGFGPDPFRPYNTQFDPYVFGVAPGGLSPLGAGVSQNQGLRGANQFGNYLESLREGNGAGRRYDQANRAYDQQFGRQYQPNRKADAGFQERRAETSELYFQYLRERDPRKRAALLQEYKLARGRATRDLSGSPNARNTRPPAPPTTAAPEEGAAEPGANANAISNAARSPAARRPAPAASAAPSTPADGRPSGRSPSEVLERARESNIPPPPALPGAGNRAPAIPPAPPTSH